MDTDRLVKAGIVINRKQLFNIMHVLKELRHGERFGGECWCPDGMHPESLHQSCCVRASLMYDDIRKLLGLDPDEGEEG